MIRQTLQLAEHDGHAIPFGQSGHLLVKGLELLARDQWQLGSVHVADRFDAHHIPSGGLASPPALVPHPRRPRRPQGHAIKPMSEQLRPADRAGPPRQDQERGLEGVLGGVPVAQDLPADAQHHRPVAADQGRERDLGQLVAMGVESRQQLTVAHPRNRSRVHDRLGSFQDRF